MVKIVRILLILVTIFTMAFYLPSTYRKAVEKRPMKTMIYYSEVSNDFVIARETGDSLDTQAAMRYYTPAGTQLTEEEYMRLLPFNNRRKLKLMGNMPDSLHGVALTTDVLKNVKRSMLLAPRSSEYHLYPLFESAPERLGVSLPDDLFRFTGDGIEFVDCKTGDILTEKSARFRSVMEACGFMAPACDVYGIPSVLKRWDSGYFVVDATGGLYHLMMVKGAPFCRKIDTDIAIKNMKCHTDEEVFAHIFDTQNRLYVLTTDYTIKPLETDVRNGRFFMTSNCFARTYKTSEADSSIMYVFSPDFEPLGRYAEVVDHYSHTDEAKWEQRIFPFSVMKTPGYAHFIPLFNAPAMFWLTNLLCAILWVGLKVYHRRRLTRPENIADFVVVLLTGVYGLMAVLLYPNRK